ncbi:MAG: adenylate/guanylate cyclase domain-containing protein [Motilibacteraceae bacterium]
MSEPTSGVPAAAAAFEELVLGGPRRYTREQVAELAGVSVAEARRYWRALGFPDVGEDPRTFTDADVDALRLLVRLVRDGVLEEDLAVSLTRALGHTMARLVEWEVEALTEQLLERRGLQRPDSLLEGVALGAAHLDELERLLVFAWRRQVAAAASRVVAAAEAGVERGLVTVGFADLVAFSRLSQRLSERELAALVRRFEELANDVVAAGHGRVVKTVGDEVLFVADQAPDAARIALALAAAMAAEPGLPDVRIGLATGPVVARFGDVFGRTVNLASRLTAMAQPGTVLVDRGTTLALEGVDGFVVDREQVRAVRGLGLVEPAVLRAVG